METIEQGVDFGILKYKDCALDFALIEPLHSLPIAMNTVNHNQLYYDLQFEEFWDFDENPGFLRDFLLNAVVSKIGYATGMTSGKVVEVNETNFFVESEGVLLITETLGVWYFMRMELLSEWSQENSSPQGFVQRCSVFGIFMCL